MLQQEFGTKFIGFTNQRHCSKCNNDTHFVVRQSYVKQRAYLIPIGTSHGSVRIVCPICESEDLITRASVFSSTESYEKLESLLLGGKELIKIWFLKQDSKGQRDYLKRLNSLKAYQVVRYLSGL